MANQGPPHQREIVRSPNCTASFDDDDFPLFSCTFIAIIFGRLGQNRALSKRRTELCRIEGLESIYFAMADRGSSGEDGGLPPRPRGPTVAAETTVVLQPTIHP